MKRVLHLRSSCGLYGAERVVLELSRLSSAFGYECTIGAITDSRDKPCPDLVQKAVEEHIPVVVFPGNGRLDLGRLRKIRMHAARCGIDILHSHDVKSDFHALFSGVRVPRVATNHQWGVVRDPSNAFIQARSRLYSLIDSFLLQSFDLVVGVSDDINSRMQRKGVRHPKKVFNGVNTSVFAPGPGDGPLREQLVIGRDDPVLGMVSSLTPEKGHALAIEAMSTVIRRYPRAKLVIVGDGPDRQACTRQAERLSLEKAVIFTGWRNDIPRILSIMDIFLLPSWVEGLSIALLEAMACGKAVISSQVGEHPRVIDHEVNGLLVEPGSARDLEEAVLGLLANRHHMHMLGINARKTAVERFSSRGMAQEYCRLYDTLS